MVITSKKGMLKIHRLQMAIDELDTQYRRFVGLAEEFREADFESESCLSLLYSMHQRTEKILKDLLGFFEIRVDSAPHLSTSRDRFHEALLETFCKLKNPLRGILGHRDAQKSLKAWKRLRNQWVGHKHGKEYDYSLEENLYQTRMGIPSVIQSLKYAVVRASKIAQRGEQVMKILERGCVGSQ